MSSGDANQEAPVKKSMTTAKIKRQQVKVTTTAIRASPASDEFQVLVRVEAAREVEERAPIDLVAVLDVSGSMSSLPDSNTKPTPSTGEKSRLDHLKTAMTFIVEKLATGDRLAIVPFSHEVDDSDGIQLQSIASKQDLDKARQSVEQLKAGGGTWFLPALQKAVDVLESRDGDDKKRRRGFIVFLSDGEEVEDKPEDSMGNRFWADVRRNKNHELRSKLLCKYQIDTFGFSKFHDPTPLATIADASCGTYSFLVEGFDKMKEAFAYSLGGINSVIAVNITINLRASQGAEIVRIESGGYNRHWDTVSGRIQIPVLYAGEAKHFIVLLRMPDHYAAAGTSMGDHPVILNARGGYSYATDTGVTGTIEADAVSDEEAVAVLKTEMARFELLGVLEKLLDIMVIGKPWDCEKMANQLHKDWGHKKESWANLLSAGDITKKFDDAVQEMVDSFIKPEGLPGNARLAYICSWVSSHRMERPTTAGAPGKIAGDCYKTPDIHSMVDVAKNDNKALPHQPQLGTDADENTTVQVQKVELLVPAAGDALIPYGEERKDFPVLLRVVAPPKEERAPIDLLVMIDVSGSMNEKTTSSKLPTRLSMAKAVAQMFKNRLGHGDRLAIVPFNTDVVHPTELVEMNYSGKLLVHKSLMGLRAGGDTRFLPALKYASGLLHGRKDPCRPGFVFFLSDGEDSSIHGPQSLAAHVSNDYPVDTVGLCQRCSPVTMVQIAKHTGGTYHPVNEDPSNIARVVGNFLGGILSVTTVKTRIHLHAPPDVRITKITSGSYANNILQEGKFGTIHVGAMYADEEKKFIIHLSIPTMATEGNNGAGRMVATAENVLMVSGGYKKPTESMEEPLGEKSVAITRFGSRGPARPPSALTTYNRLLIAEIVRTEVVKIVATVVGKHKDADQKVIANELEAAWNKFKSNQWSKVLQELVAGSVEWQRYADKQVVEQQGDVNGMLVSLMQEDYVGMQHVHAWLAGNSTQRATTMAAGAVTTVWFQQQYMQHMATEVFYDAAWSSLLVTPPQPLESDRPFVKKRESDRPADGLIDQRLEVWSRVKRELPLLFQPLEDAQSNHLTAVFREASLEAINRAMHHDMYLAVVHASNLRRCYCAREQPADQPHEPLAPTKPSQ